MVKRSEIVEFLNRELALARFTDRSLNGLQFEGADEVSHLAVAVDAGQTVLQQAAKLKAEMLFVHHGILWDKPLAWVGPLRQSLQTLVSNNLSLYAAHLPLDAHSTWGNNFTLARRLGLENLRPAIEHRGQTIACVGENKRGALIDHLAETLAKLPGATSAPLVLAFGPAIPKNVCVVTGAGADALESAIEEGFDTLVTGEPRQSAYHYAKDNGLNLICAGHYATETVGIIEVAKALEQKFKIKYSFIDIPTGI